MEWNDESIERIRALWAEGLSTAEIGRRMGITKNAVVGKAHRLSLPPRPSPIRRGAGDKAARRSVPRRSVGNILPALPTMLPPAPPAATQAAPPRPVLVRPAAALRPVPSQPRQTGRVSSCCWPLGEPGTPGFRFCGDPTAPSKPYCDEHVAVAYVRVRDRREDAA